MIGHQRPRIWRAPGPVQGTLGQEAIDVAAMAGLYLDDWQQFLTHNGCSIDPSKTYYNKINKRQENKWSALEMGVVVSRQNGKGSWLEARELAGLFVFGERLITHSAHEFKTSKNHFERLASLIEDTPELKKKLALNGITRGNSGVAIKLKTGQMVSFQTRTKSGGRGLTGDLLVLDEAMFLGAEAIGALMPTLAARPNTQVIYTGSAGDIELGDCSQLGRLRTRATGELEEPRLVFAEWSIDACNDFCEKDCEEHDDPYSEESYAKSNPGYGIRIDLDHIEMERRSMEKRTFFTERLGVGHYPIEGEAWSVISRDKWMARHNAYSKIEGGFALGVDVTPDCTYSCISACGAAENEPGSEHVEVTGRGPGDLDHRPGTQWVIPRIKEIWDKWHPAFVVIDTVSNAGSFVAALENLGIKVISPNSREYAQSCAEFRSAVVPQKDEKATLMHLGQTPLAAALAEADRRKLLEMWAWNKRTSGADISPLVSATLAHWGYKKHLFTSGSADPFVFYDDGSDIDDWEWTNA